MNKKKKTVFWFLLLCFMLSDGIFAGAEESEEKITFRIAHFWGNTDTDVSAKYYKEILENEFPEAFPNVELNQEICDNATYKTKIKIMAATDELPDIFFSYGAGFSQAFVDSEKVLALDSWLDEFYKERMNMGYQENFIYDGQQYGICFTNWVGVLYCNKALFAKAGAEIPKTYEELLRVCKKLRLYGIEPIACGMLDKWHGQQWINNFTIQLGGAELYKSMARGDASLDNRILAKAANLVLGLINADAFCSDMYQLTSSEAEDLFLNGQAAMIYIGSWYTDSAEESLGNDLEAVRMPIVPGALYEEDYHGGGINGWMVSANTENPELATEIAAWLAWRLGCYQVQNSSFYIEEKEQESPVSAVKQKIMDFYSDSADCGCAWDTLMVPEWTEKWLSLCAKLFDRKFSGEGFVKMLRSQINWGAVAR